jgi:hypothetical protein
MLAGNTVGRAEHEKSDVNSPARAGFEISRRSLEFVTADCEIIGGARIHTKTEITLTFFDLRTPKRVWERDTSGFHWTLLILLL